MGRAANNFITSRQGRHFHTTVTFERPSVPPQTQRIWTWGAPPGPQLNISLHRRMNSVSQANGWVVMHRLAA
eukprot:1568302-Prymnesium_polylepis.1